MKNGEHNNEVIDVVSKVFLKWSVESLFNPNKFTERDPEIYESSFICKVIDKRMKVFGIDIKIPDYLIVIIDLCTGSNPGQSFMILSEILENIPNLKPGHVISPNDFSRVYGTRFPVLELYPDINSRLEKRWDNQKIRPTGTLGTDNQCDTPEYWLKFFK